LTFVGGGGIPDSMSATAEIRALCDQPGRELREALIRYSKGNARAPYAIQADRMLYGDLVRHYLQWCAGLLTKMEEAAAARPAWKDAVTQLLECSAAYFKDTARWPSVPHLDHPLRLLLPACYAMRAARRVNSLTEPALVAVDFTEPNEFVTEVLGRVTSEQISQQKNDDFKSLERITEDPPSEPKPLHHRSFLHEWPRAQLAKARAAKPEPPKVVPPPPPAAPPTISTERDKALAESWSLELSDTRITLARPTPWFHPDYKSGYVSKESFLDLFRWHRYRLVERYSGRASSGGIDLSGPTREESEGEWKVHVVGSDASLVLAGDDGSVDYYRIEKVSQSTLKLRGREYDWAAL
jgi:hypothetical protein